MLYQNSQDIHYKYTLQTMTSNSPNPCLLLERLEFIYTSYIHRETRRKGKTEGRGREEMPGVWFALKKSLPCKSTPSDLHEGFSDNIDQEKDT